MRKIHIFLILLVATVAVTLVVNFNPHDKQNLKIGDCVRKLGYTRTGKITAVNGIYNIEILSDGYYYGPYSYVELVKIDCKEL